MKSEFVTKIEIRDPNKTWVKDGNILPEILRAGEKLSLDDEDFNVIQLLASGAVERVTPKTGEIAKEPKVWDDVKPSIDTRTERENSVYQKFLDEKDNNKKK